jgi:hypothetical protein
VNQGRRDDSHVFQFYIYAGSILPQGYFPLIPGIFNNLMPEKKSEQYEYQQHRQGDKKKKKLKVP